MRGIWRSAAILPRQIPAAEQSAKLCFIAVFKLMQKLIHSAESRSTFYFGQVGA